MFKIKSKRLAENIFFVSIAMIVIVSASFTGHNFSLNNRVDASDCSTFNGDQTSCQAQMGCSWDMASCGSFYGDYATCVSHGECTYPGNAGDCSAFSDEPSCGSYGCTTNYFDCSSLSDGGGDGTSCNSQPGCSYDESTGTCSGSPFSSCSGTYDNGLCSGSYALGTCSGTYDTTAPTLSSAATNVAGTAITLTYNEALDTNSIPAGTDFVITAGGTPVPISGSPVVSGSTVVLNLAFGGVSDGASISITYNAPVSGPIQDVAGNDAGNLSGQSVTNYTDTIGPTLSPAVINGNEITLTYNEDVVLNSTTSVIVKQNGASFSSISSTGISGHVVTLTLADSVVHSDTVTIDYDGTSFIHDAAGNYTGAKSNYTLTNNTGAGGDVTPPVLSSATVNDNVISLLYNEALDDASIPAVSDFVVNVNGSPVSKTSVAIAGVGVTVTLPANVGIGATVTINYTPGGSPIQDVAGNDAGSLSGATVTNISAAPVLQTAVVNGTNLTLTYNKTLDASSVPATSAFAVNVSGSPITVSSVNVTGTTVVLALAIDLPICFTHVFTVSYTAPAGGKIRDAAHNDAESLGSTSASDNDGNGCSIAVGDINTFSTVSGDKVYVNNNGSGTVSVIDVKNDTVIATISTGGSPVYSSTVGSKVYVVSDTTNNVFVIDTTTDTVIKTIPVGSVPEFSSVVGQKVYVHNSVDGTISVIDTATDTVTATITVGTRPFSSLAVGTRLYVNNQDSNNVSVIDTTNNTVIATIPVGIRPYNTFALDSKVYVTNSGNFGSNFVATVSVISTLSNTVIKTINVGHSSVGGAIVGTKFYVNNNTEGNVSVIDTETDEVIDTITVGDSPYYSSFVGNKVYVNNNAGTVSVIDTTTDTVVATIPVGTNPHYSVVANQKIYVDNSSGSTVSVINTSTDTLYNIFAPYLISITSSTANGTYTEGQNINITANFNKTLGAGSRMRITLNTGAVVDLTSVAGSTLVGTYTIGSNETTPDLSISSISSNPTFTSVSDSSSPVNTKTSFAVPKSPELTGDTSYNLGDLENIIIAGPYCSISVGTEPYQLATVGTKVYVANQGSNSVSVIDTTADNTVIATISVQGQPYGVAYNSTSKEVYVANLASSTVSVIDADPAHSGTTYNTVTHTVSVGVEPYYVASLGTNIYVTNNVSNTVSVIATGSHTVTDTINVGVAPRGIKAHASNGKLYVANFGSLYGGQHQGTVSVIDSTNNTVSATINVGSGPRGVAVNGNEVYVANWNDNTVSVISTASNTVTHTINVGNGPRGVMSLGSNIYVENYKDGTISVIATGSHSVTDTVDVGNTPAGMTAIGTDIYVSRFTDGVVSVLDTTASPKALRSSCPISDTTAPTITLTVPSTGDTVYGNTVTLTATSTDDTAVTGVQFNVDGIDVGDASTTSPYSIIWDSTSATNGTHTISAVAHDAAGNYATSSISVTVDNAAPTLSITAPADTSTVTTFSPSVSWGDSATCEYKFDSGSFASLTCASNGSDIATPSSGAHTLTIRGTDTSNNATTTSSSFTYSPVTVNNTTNNTSDQQTAGATGWSSGGATQTPIYPKSPNPLCPAGYTCTPITLGSNTVGTGNTSANANSQIPEGYKFFRDLTLGSRGTDVQRLQQFLNENLFHVSQSGAGSPGKETAIFGPATKNALSRFQKAHAVYPSLGYFGVVTRKLVNYMLGL